MNLFLILAIILLIKVNRGVSLESTLDYCCNRGNLQALERNHCLFPNHTEGIEVWIKEDDISRCQISFEICCAQTLETSRCDLTKEFVINEGIFANCSSVPLSFNHSTTCVNKCCECCKIGLITLHDGKSCSELESLKLCDNIALDCCEYNITKLEISNEIVEKTFDKRCFELGHCSPICSPTINGKNICKCPNGFYKRSMDNNCVDINECLEGINNCTYNEMCINIYGTYKCVPDITPYCGKGFIWKSKLFECQDVNECEFPDLNTCEMGMRCENLPGSYKCRRILGCGTGYIIDNVTQKCYDVNECETGTHDCQESFECVNTKGSFRCVRKICPKNQTLDAVNGRCDLKVCPPGFYLDIFGDCVDIDECKQLDICHEGQVCMNEQGSYKCKNTKCHLGYQMDEDRNCIDIDECQIGIHNCHGGQICSNLKGGFNCDCPPNHYFDRDYNQCKINRVIGCDPYKNNCGCASGFQLSRYSECIDIDECLNTTLCEHSCSNTRGSYICQCKDGYRLNENKHNCDDVNECHEFFGANSLCQGMCINEIGSFKCGCPDGYHLLYDGRSCKDIDECMSPNLCKDEQICINTRGSYVCKGVICPPNYILKPSYNKNIQENGYMCDKNCDPYDITCLLNNVLTYRYQFITMPSTTKLYEPISIASIFPISNSDKMKIHCSINSGNYGGFFDILTTPNNSCQFRLVQPIFGPYDEIIHIKMDVASQYYVPRRVSHMFMLNIFVSKYKF
ncbi:unnamed protein product [Gordionus sp. m RMFG-2023]|uniref:fibrillin-2-like n=1 Tax=Gordionus sp. m RMFG-2023 TaxID=3053472 RepID=UPI0030DF7393